MGFGPEMLFMIFFGLVLLGPKQLHSLLGHVARLRSEVEKASRSMKSELAAGSSSGFPAQQPETRPDIGRSSEKTSAA